MGNEATNKNDLKRTIDGGDGKTRPFCLDTKKLAVKRSLGKSTRTVKLKMNENA